MKRAFLALSVMAIALVSCNKPTPEPKKPVEYTGAAKIEIAEGTNFYSVKFTANANWKAQIESDDETGVTIDKTSGVAGEQTIKVSFEDLEETQTGRISMLAVSTVGFDTVPAEGEYFTVFFMQGKVFAAVNTNDTVGREGGKVVYNIVTNCDYAIKTYDGADQAFPWAPVTHVKGESVTFNVEANTGYDPRTAYVKFTVDEIQVEEAAYVVRAYVNQEGAVSVAWSKAADSFGVATMAAVGGVARLGEYNGTLYISDGAAITAVDAATGAVKETANVAANSMDVDAAGNIVYLESAIAYGASAPVMVIKNGKATELCQMPNNVYSNGLAHLTVTGDVTKNAILCAQTDLYNYCTYIEIKDGKAGEPVMFALPSNANWETWGGINWNSQRNGCVKAIGTTAAEGFLYTVYDGSYCLFKVMADGSNEVIYDYTDKEGGSNINFQTIDVCNWNGVNYAVLGLTTYFSWGDCPNFVLVNLDTKTMVSKFDCNAFDTITPEFIGANDGENAAADVCLVPEKDKLGVVMYDILNNIVYRVNYPVL